VNQTEPPEKGPARRPVRVLVVDDHRLFAEALQFLLEAEEDVSIVGLARSGEDALAMLPEAAPDVVLMDIDLPAMSGIEATRRIRAASPSTQVVVITALQGPAEMAAAIFAGACGFVPKTQAVHELVGAIHRAVAGDFILPSKDLNAVLARLQAAQRSRSHVDGLLDQLTSREIELLQAIAEGVTTKELAERLFISRQTVQTHVKNILVKLGVHSKLEAVAFVIRHGLVQLPSHWEGSRRIS
jgi:DNA-binding NarL/FixJ family response regulator